MQIGPVRTRPQTSPEWLVHCLALLILFLLEPSARRSACALRPAGVMVAGPAGPAGGLGAGRGRVDPRRVRYRDRAGCAAATASGRGIRTGRSCPAPSWRLAAAWHGFRAGAPACGLQWWENPNVVPGMIPGFGAPAAATASLLQLQAAANAPPPAPHAMPSRSRACPVACVMAGRISAAGFCPCRPRSADRAARLPGTANICHV